jgi:osmotically-inducible protein OsmY
MASRYDRDNDRDYDRGAQDYRRRESEYGRGSYGERSESMYGDAGETEADKYTRRLGSDRNRFSMGSSDEYRNRGENRGDYDRGREGYWGRGWENEHNERSRYGNPIGGSGFERGYNQSRNDYSQRYNYPSGYSSGQNYGERNYDYDRDRERNRGNEGRGWWDRASDEVASWFGDEEADRRRRMDEQRQHRGRGPKGYRRSDERIKEDVNDRLSDDYYLDASDVEVSVQNTEVTLTGTVQNRNDKRRAEDLAESVSGVTNVENRLRVKQADYGRYGRNETSSITDTSGTPGTTTSSAAAGGGTTASRGRTAGT